VDAISIVTEGVADGFIRSRSRYTLANANSANALACTGCLVAMSLEACKVSLGIRSATATRDGETFWDQPKVRLYLDALLGLAKSGSSVMSSGHVVPSGKPHLGT
jgi:hypothetical protein